MTIFNTFFEGIKEERKRQGHFVQDSAKAHKLQIVPCKVSSLKLL